MKAYIGVDIVLAEPSNLKETNPELEDALGYTVIYPDGEEVWMAKEEFEIQYREITEEESNLVVDSLVDEYDDSFFPEEFFEDEEEPATEEVNGVE